MNCYEEFSKIPGKTDVTTEFFVRCRRTYVLNNKNLSIVFIMFNSNRKKNIQTALIKIVGRQYIFLTQICLANEIENY